MSNDDEAGRRDEHRKLRSDADVEQPADEAGGDSELDEDAIRLATDSEDERGTK